MVHVMKVVGIIFQGRLAVIAMWDFIQMVGMVVIHA